MCRERSERARERPAREPACASATSPSWSARPRARSATTRRSACCPRRPRGLRAQHRLYTQSEVERLREVMRLKDLLGRLARGAEDAAHRRGGARGGARAAAPRGRPTPSAARAAEEALGHIDRQLELVRHRAAELAKLERRAAARRRKRVRRKRIRELDAAPRRKEPAASGDWAAPRLRVRVGTASLWRVEATVQPMT